MISNRLYRMISIPDTNLALKAFALWAIRICFLPVRGQFVNEDESELRARFFILLHYLLYLPIYAILYVNVGDQIVF